MRIRPLAAGLAVSVALVSAGCGSSKHNAATSTSAPTTASTAPVSATPVVSNDVPEVANAANLSVEPKVSPGKSPKPGQLTIKDLVVGNGQAATVDNSVKVQYVGANFDDGATFDSSWKTGQPIVFSLHDVIPGFAQGIVGMKPGGRREIVIPPALGYGAAGSGPVGPNETLVFVVDVITVS